MNWQNTVPDAYALAESPFWHPHEQTLYWVDIAGRQILRANVYMGSVQAWDMPSEPGCIAPAASGGLVVALRHGIFRAREWGGSLEHIVSLDYDTASVRANDGKCDALGRFWVGTYDETKQQRAAALYCIDCRNGRVPQVERKASDALTGNGLAWSPDNRTLYWADTSSHVVYAWDYDLQTNELSGRRNFLTFEGKPVGWKLGDGGYAGRPDGAAVDTQGNYWVALYEGQRVCQFSPQGTLLVEYATPVPCPTMPCLGGEDFQTLYLTSARHRHPSEQTQDLSQAGGVFSTRVSIAGLPVNFFAE
jgi:sugar lactone lactonase YvrE